MRLSRVPVALALGAIALASVPVFGHGSVTPQAFPTPGLPDLGTKWLDKNPFRGNKTAIEIRRRGLQGKLRRMSRP